MRVVWKVREYLQARGLEVKALVAVAPSREASFYRLTSPSKPPRRVDLDTLGAVLNALDELTGEHAEVGDVLARSDDASGGTPQGYKALLFDTLRRIDDLLDDLRARPDEGTLVTDTLFELKTTLKEALYGPRS